MSQNERQRWEAHVDKEALGEALSADEQLERDRIASSDAGCAKERDVYQTLSGALERASMVVPKADRLILNALDEVPPFPALRDERPRTGVRAGWAWALCGATAAAGAFGLMTWFGGEPAHTASAPGAPPRASASASSPGALRTSLSFSAGVVSVNGSRVIAGSKLEVGSVLESEEGSACLGLERQVIACIAAHSKVRVVALGQHQQLELVAGRVVAVLAPQPAESRFEVTTRAGSAVALGTIFAVEVGSDGSTLLRVTEGVVKARTEKLELLVRPGRELRLGSAELTRLSHGTLARDAAVLASLSGWAPDQAQRVRAGYAALHVDAEEAVRAADEQASTRAPTAAELLSRAGKARSRAAYRAAAQHYEQLIRSYPQSAEASPARVGLAEVRLAHLGDARGALALYEQYLASGGRLAREAHYGKIQALRALGRAQDARAEAVLFSKRYPKSAYTRSLEQQSTGKVAAGARDQ